MQSLRQARGYGSFKLRGGIVNGNDAENWPGRTDDLIKQCHKVLGPHVELYVDANGGYSKNRSVEILELLSQNNVKFLEEPCPYWEHTTILSFG